MIRRLDHVNVRTANMDDPDGNRLHLDFDPSEAEA